MPTFKRCIALGCCRGFVVDEISIRYSLAWVCGLELVLMSSWPGICCYFFVFVFFSFCRVWRRELVVVSSLPWVSRRGLVAMRWSPWVDCRAFVTFGLWSKLGRRRRSVEGKFESRAMALGDLPRQDLIQSKGKILVWVNMLWRLCWGCWRCLCLHWQTLQKQSF